MLTSFLRAFLLVFSGISVSSIFARITLEYVRGCFCPEDSTLHLSVAPYCPFCSWNHLGPQTLSLLGLPILVSMEIYLIHPLPWKLALKLCFMGHPVARAL